jgi:chromosomal replication initiator protein
VEEEVPRHTPDAAHDLAATWSQAQQELRSSVSDSTYQLWFEQLRPVSSRGPILFLTGPRHVLRWVGKRYPELLRAAIRKGGSGLKEFDLITSESAVADTSSSSAEAAARVTLNPAYTFDRFVIGPGSQFAHAAALAVAEAPGEAYNPLFLHGPPGLGKTHLLGAIANYLHHHNPELTVHYTTAECFTNEFVSSLQGTGIEEFKRRYRRADVLLIDDVQFLQGKARTADEFFHTFNALYEAGAQLVLTADRLPAELNALAERLRDRFEWGLTVAVEPPDLPTRLVFLANLTREQSEQVAPEALRAIASRAISNLRLLEGALTRILALERLLSPSRVAPVARARQLAMYLSRELTDLSLPEIAAAFNRRDHTTVMHAIRKVEAKVLEDAALARTIEQLTSDLSAPTIDRDRTD